MDDTNKSDPILKQVPLVKNPSFQPPKPIALSSNYSKLIPTLRSSIVPPSFPMNKHGLNNWSSDLENIKNELLFDDTDTQKFKDWLKAKRTIIAPGLESLDDVITPKKSAVIHNDKNEFEASTLAGDINEIDEAFGKTRI